MSQNRQQDSGGWFVAVERTLQRQRPQTQKNVVHISMQTSSPGWQRVELVL